MKANVAEESLSIVAGIMPSIPAVRQLESGLLLVQHPCLPRTACQQAGGNAARDWWVTPPNFMITMLVGTLEGPVAGKGHARETFVANGSKSW